jgi:hypothetical protein
MTEIASDAQLKFLHDLGFKGKPPFSKADASKEITKLKTIQQAKALAGKVNYEPTDEELKKLDKVIGMYVTCLTKCIEVDIIEPAVIGMLLNNWRQMVDNK